MGLLQSIVNAGSGILCNSPIPSVQVLYVYYNCSEDE